MGTQPDFGESDFEQLEALLDLAPPTRVARLAAIEPADRRRVLEQMLALADRESALDQTARKVFPELVRPESLEDAGLTIMEEIGQGGMGVVYRAHDERLDRLVAVKVLTSFLSPEADQRFHREEEAALKFDHPAIVPLFRAGEAGGLRYLVFELVEGMSLATRIAAEAGASPTPKTPAVAEAWCWRVAEWMRWIALALDYAHGRGVVHRDVKPGNILLDGGDLPRLTDFGIAKSLDATTLTRTGQQPGTPPYMSPEQVGILDGEIDPRTDVCGLGLVLYEALTLSKARPGADVEEVRRQWRTRPVLDPLAASKAVPPALAMVCRRAMALEPADRYQSAGEMASALDRAIRGQLHVPRLAWRDWLARAKRHRIKLGVSATLTIAAVGATAALWPTPPSGTLLVAAPAPTAVWVRAMDPGTRLPGPAQRLGVTPIAATLPPGVYRVLIPTGDGTASELTRVVQRGQRALVEFVPSARTAAAEEAMVLIAGGDAFVGQPVPQFPQLAQRLVRVEPFWIDRREVSNAEYRMFVQATGRQQPALWPVPYDPSWDDLPVAGVSLEDARAYAEWVGKRLPTDVEWEIAAAGRNGAPFPWVATGGPPASIVTDGGVERASWVLGPDDPTSAAAYAANVRPVDQAGNDVGPNGLVNAWSNVAEWTESVLVVDMQGVPLQWAISKGRTWADAAPALAFLQTANLAELDHRSVGLGFRCARSASAAQN